MKRITLLILTLFIASLFAEIQVDQGANEFRIYDKGNSRELHFSVEKDKVRIGNSANAVCLEISGDLTITGNITASETVQAEQLTSTDDLTVANDATLGQIICTDNVGTAGDNTTAVEYGNGHWHKTVLTVSATADTIAGGAALALGELVYTFPESTEVAVKCSYINMALDEADGNITSDTPDIGLGTTIGSGENATLNAVDAAAENIMTGQSADDCEGTAEVIAVNTFLYIGAAADHTVYFNIADDWAASGEDALSVAGTIILEWVFLE